MMPQKRKIVYYISEILQMIKNEPDDEKKVQILKDNESKYLRDILYANFSSHISWLVSDNIQYTINNYPIGMTDTNLFREVKKLYLYMALHNIPCYKNLSQQKRDLMFSQVLSNMQKDESFVLFALAQKRLGSIFNLPRQVVVKAFPNLLSQEDATIIEENVSNVSEEAVNVVVTDVTPTPSVEDNITIASSKEELEIPTEIENNISTTPKSKRGRKPRQ